MHLNALAQSDYALPAPLSIIRRCGAALIGLWMIPMVYAQPVFNPGPNGSVETWAGGGDPDGHVPYHPQITAYFCGAAAMEMEIDCNAVRNNNAVLDKMLGGGVAGAHPPAAAVDGAPVPCFPGQGACWPAPVFQGNQVVGGAQSYCYGLVHGINLYNGNSYVNPFYPLGMGTSLDELTAGLNLMDSPANNNAGPHNYVGYNIPANPDWANRTMAAALANPALGIPSAATVNHGAHWISVVGVRSDVVPVLNKKYTIFGFFVRDPWTGYQQAVKKDARGKALPLGMGENKYFSTKVNAARADQWASIFNLAGGPPLPLYGSGVGYKFEVEPLGPEPLDTGNNGEFTSVPPPSPVLTNAPLTAWEALAYASNSVAADEYMSSQTGFEDGGWDVADAILVQYPSDIAGEGDWLIPYDGADGTNDVTGFALIDMQTGDLDEAGWMNPGDDVPSMTLADVDAMEDEEYLGDYPDDNVDEPQLGLQVTNNTVVLSWSTPALSTYTYVVQQNDSLTSTNWVTLPVPVTDNATNDLNQVVLPASAAQSFFRLSASQ